MFFKTLSTSALHAVTILVAVVFLMQNAKSQEQPLQTSVGVRFVSRPQISQQAAAAWANLPDKSSPDLLDAFISRYAGTSEARIAFSLRVMLVRSSRSIPGYNKLIDAYPDVLLTPTLVQEVYELYHEQETIAAYLDFMRRHPRSLQAYLAKLQVERLAFDVAETLNAIAEYEAFIERFPDAAHVSLAFENATSLAKTAEMEIRRKARADNNDPITIKDNEEKRVIELVKSWDTVRKEMANLPDAERRTGTLARKLCQLDQHAIRIKVYDNPEVTKFINSQILSEIQAELIKLRKSIERSHEDLVKQLRDEFSNTNRILETGFKELVKGQQNIVQAVEKVDHNIDALRKGMEQLHQDLQGIHSDLQKIDSRLGTIHEDLQKINGTLVNMTSVISSGFAQTNQNLAALLVAERQTQTNQQIQTDLLVKMLQQQSSLADDIASMSSAQAGSASAPWYTQFVPPVVVQNVSNVVTMFDKIPKPGGEAGTVLDRLLCGSSVFRIATATPLALHVSTLTQNQIPSIKLYSMNEREVYRIMHKSAPSATPFISHLMAVAYGEKANGLAAVHKRLTTSPLPDTLSPLRVNTREEYEQFADGIAKSVSRPRHLVETLSERTGIRF